MSTKHTPGEWRVRGTNGLQVVFGEGGDICELNPRLGYSIEQRKADAKLIAAAPDLLAFALKVSEYSPSQFPEVKALIAKATGQPTCTAEQHNANPKGRWG